MCKYAAPSALYIFADKTPNFAHAVSIRRIYAVI